MADKFFETMLNTCAGFKNREKKEKLAVTGSFATMSKDTRNCQLVWNPSRDS